MLNAPNNQYNPFVPVQQQPQAQVPQQAPIQQAQGPQQAPNGGIYSYPTSSCYMPPQTDFNGVKLVINGPSGLSTNGMMPQVPFIPYPMPYQAPAGINYNPQYPAAQPAQPAQTPEPAVKTEPATNRPEVQNPTDEVPGVKVQSFTAGLNSDDINAQAKAMQDICDAAKSDKKTAALLVCNEVFDGLLNIINKDVSGLQGPTEEILAKREDLLSKATTPEQRDEAYAQTLTEKEAYLLHQREALFTIAVLHNAMIDIAEGEGKEVQLHTLPAIETVVGAIKDNPQPMLRAAGIQALAHIARPSFKPELSEIFSIATTDADPGVQEIATKASEELAAL